MHLNSNEIKNVKSINLENKDLTNADLAGLSEAVNCDKDRPRKQQKHHRHQFHERI